MSWKNGLPAFSWDKHSKFLQENKLHYLKIIKAQIRKYETQFEGYCASASLPNQQYKKQSEINEKYINIQLNVILLHVS